MVVKVTNSNDEICTDYGTLIDDARSMLYERSSRSVSFTYRVANSVAHKLVKLAFLFLKRRHG